MITPQRAVEIIDSLLCLYEIWPNGTITTDNSITKDALKFIAETREQNLGCPITVGLAKYMRENGYIK